jgi:hypothetical protein
VVGGGQQRAQSLVQFDVAQIEGLLVDHVLEVVEQHDDPLSG